MKPSTERPQEHDIGRHAPSGILEQLHQQELRRLAVMQQQLAALEQRIGHQLRRVRMAERLMAGGGQQ